MSNLTMPTPVGYLSVDWYGAVYLPKLTASHAPSEKTKPIYTAEALSDVLEQAARLCDAQDGTHDHIYSAAVRALIKEVK